MRLIANIFGAKGHVLSKAVEEQVGKTMLALVKAENARIGRATGGTPKPARSSDKERARRSIVVRARRNQVRDLILAGVSQSNVAKNLQIKQHIVQEDVRALKKRKRHGLPR